MRPISRAGAWSRRVLVEPAAATVLFGAGGVIFRASTGLPCYFKASTGWECPACGATRAAFALARGHLALALRDNALAIAMLAAVMCAVFVQGRRGTELLARLPTWSVVMVLVGWAFVRNLPPLYLLRPVGD